MRITALLLVTLLASTVLAHPGGAIAVAADGTVYFVDTGAGVFSIDRTGRVVKRDGPAFHWFAFDPEGRFLKTPLPSTRDAELRSAGVNPSVVLSSDYPVTIADGKFYYPQPAGDRVRLVAVEPSGKQSVRATLPPIRRGAQTVAWLNGLAPGPNGLLYYTEDHAIRSVDARGRVATLAGNVSVPQCTAVPGIEAEGPYLRGLAVAADGSIYVAASGCAALLRVDPKGHVSTVLRAERPWSPTAVAVAGGEVYVLEYLHTASDNRREWLPRVRKISRTGKITTLGGNTR
jgi:hypothetical protein